MATSTWVKISTFLSSAGPPPNNYIKICALPIDLGDAPVGFTEDARQYSSVTAMLDDGFLATDQVVLQAGEVFGQGAFTTTVPTRLVVVKRAAPVPQVMEFTSLVTDDGDYKLFISVIGGTAEEAATFAAVGQTLAQIKDALETAFNLGPFAATQTAGTVDVDTGSITADVAGAPFILTATGPNGAADFQIDTATPNSGLYEDLDAGFKLFEFWAVIPDPAESEGTMLEAGRWAEQSAAEGTSRRNIALLQSADQDIITATTPNFASVNVGLGRTRTFIVFHANATDKMSAAEFGRYGGQAAGSRAWHLGEQGGTSLTTTINYTVAENEILKAARVSWIERDGPAATAPLQANWGQGSGGFFVVQKQAEDFWWLSMRQSTAAKLRSLAGMQLDDAGVRGYVSDVWIVNNILGSSDPPVIDLDRTTVTTVPLEDVPASEIQIGQYAPPSGGVNVTTVLIAHGRTLGVSAVFALGS